MSSLPFSEKLAYNWGKDLKNGKILFPAFLQIACHYMPHKEKKQDSMGNRS